MSRILFTCAYEGSHWRGWQSQTGGNTIQDAIEEAFLKVVREPCRIHAAGRTDAGVHAEGQCFHVDFPERCRIPSDRWPLALNAQLPSSVRILKADPVSETFHARFSAVGKIYRYRMEKARVLSPFLADRAWAIRGDLDEIAMENALKMFCGEHDFRAFAARRGNEPTPLPSDYFVRRIHSAELKKEGDSLFVTLRGTGFLYKMVRLIVGAVSHIGFGQMTLDELRRLLEDPQKEKSPYCAPACGLYLESVLYSRESFLLQSVADKENRITDI